MLKRQIWPAQRLLKTLRDRPCANNLSCIEVINLRNKICLRVCLVLPLVFFANCGAHQASRLPAEASEIAMTEQAGVKIQTRTFKDPNSRVEKVIVTTKGGETTVRVTSRQGELLPLTASKIPNPLEASSDQIADAVGFAKRGEQAVPEPQDHAEEQLEDLRQSQETDKRLQAERQKVKQ